MARRKRSGSQTSDGESDASLFGQTGEPTDAPTEPSADVNALFDADGQGAALHDLAQSRYLNYALSVITSRALPDVRDGLKPVQRRILYTMWQQRLTADAKHRKCAKVVGDVMGNYHPHGDNALYEALVRMAQPFSLRHPLIDGSGNFGSLDGDAAAAMRYTECRMTPLATDLLSDISANTVHFRPNYDGTRSEPVVLPSKVPNLLLNGASGIAVGMATNIPPHNLGELCRALLKVLDNPEIKDFQLVANDAITGPDFPTGGQIINSRDELREIYKTGSGALKLRATWEMGPVTRSAQTLIITSIPYSVNKSNLVEAIAAVIIGRKMPLMLDVRDVSTDDVRIEVELKRDADVQKVVAYLFKQTPLQLNFNVNLTCLVPTQNPDVGAPDRLGLLEILRHFLIFRHSVVTRRLEHELDTLLKRLHILEGFALIFDALDEIIRIIRASDGKADAAKKIMKKFTQLDELQTDAILELKLYRLAKLEVNLVTEELAEKRKRVKEIRKLLADDEHDMKAGRWNIVREEIEALNEQYGGKRRDDLAGKRRTLITTVEDEPAFNAEDFIVAEDNHVLITADGWIKRQREIADPSKTRLREGDRVLACEAGSTRATMVFFSNLGTAYSCRIIDIPATTGYGEPIQKLFKLKDGEKIIVACSLDPRAIGEIQSGDEDTAPPVHLLAATSDGYALRIGLSAFVEPSTRSGRRYARPAKGQEVVSAIRIFGNETILAATREARSMICPVQEINFLAGPGKGVLLIKLGKGDRLLGCKASQGDRDLLRVTTSRGSEQTISTTKYEVTSRGGRGREILKRGQFLAIVSDEVMPPVLLDP